MNLRIEYPTQARSIRQLGKYIGDGGEGTVYAVNGIDDIAVKLYNDEFRSRNGGTALNERKEKLQVLMRRQPPRLFRGKHLRYGWPVALVYSENNSNDFLGFAMHRVPAEEVVDALAAYNPGNLKPRWMRYPILINAAANYAEQIHDLHACDLILGDINENNILIHKTGEVSIIDCDSFQVTTENGRPFYTPLFFPHYVPPELQQTDLTKHLRIPENDVFSMAVLLFRFLMRGYHPFAVINSPYDDWKDDMFHGCTAIGFPNVYERPKGMPDPKKVLTPKLQNYFRLTFGEALKQPTKRPLAKDWQFALLEFQGSLTYCPVPSCGEAWYGKRERCPHCKTALHYTAKSTTPHVMPPKKKTPPPPVTKSTTAATKPNHESGWTATGGQTPTGYKEVIKPQTTAPITSPTPATPPGESMLNTQPPHPQFTHRNTWLDKLVLALFSESRVRTLYINRFYDREIFQRLYTPLIRTLWVGLGLTIFSLLFSPITLANVISTCLVVLTIAVTILVVYQLERMTRP